MVLEGASCANAFCLLCKMHLGMLLLILGPFSGVLQNGDYGSKRVQILYIDVLMRRKTSNFEEVMSRQNPRLQHDRKPVPNAFFGRRKMHVECAQMHVGETLVVKHQPTFLFCVCLF